MDQAFVPHNSEDGNFIVSWYVQLYDCVLKKADILGFRNVLIPQVDDATFNVL